MSERTPYHFRPMCELTEECRHVEMALRDTGEVVMGWLFCGVPGEPRTFWMHAEGRSARIDPIGWRHPPTPEVLTAWQAGQAGKVTA